MRYHLSLLTLVLTLCLPSAFAQAGGGLGAPAGTFDLVGANVTMGAAGALIAEGDFIDISRGPGGSPFDDRVFALAVGPDGSVYAGGAFTAAGGVPASRVARWDGTAWQPLGSGVNNTVEALAVGPDGILYAGGSFTTAGGVPANRVARWDGAGWSPLGSGANSRVRALLVGPDGSVYAGGAFTTAGGVSASRVARWDGTVWSPLGTGLNSDVRALVAATDGTIYAGGQFFRAGTAARAYVARWDGSAWQPLGTGMNDSVYALAVSPDGSLYAGGVFTTAGGVSTSRVARWDGSAWSPLGSGAGSGWVTALAAGADGRLYAGGSFTQAGGQLASRVARWDGTAWGPLGSGMNGSVDALAIDGQGDLVLGGAFLTAGGVSSPYVSLYDVPALPAAFEFVRPEAGDDYRVGAWLKPIWTTPGEPIDRVVATLRKGNVLVAELYRGPNLTQPGFGAARWRIPVGTPAGMDYRVRVESEDAPSVFTLSGAFTITDPGASFTVTAPTEGQGLAFGSTVPVTWTAPAGASGGTVEVSLVEGGSGTVATAVTAANDGSAALTLPTSPAGSYSVVVTSVEHPFYTGRSGRVRLGAVAVAAPSGGAVLGEGEPLTVVWEAPTLSASARVTIQLKRPGTPSVRLATRTANDGTFETTVPSGVVSASDYYILVQVTDGGMVNNAKSASFTINGSGAPLARPAPTRLALSPHSFGTRAMTLAVTGLTDGTELGVYAGRSLVGAAVVSGGVAAVEVRGAVVLEALVEGVPTAADAVEVTDGTSLSLVAVSASGAAHVLDVPVSFADGSELSVAAGEARADAPAAVLTLAASPNPVSSTATVRIMAPAGERVTVEVVDVLGRRVAALADAVVPSGEATLTWDARGAAPGVYVVRAVSAEASATTRVTVVR